MSYQASHPIVRQASLSPITVDELIADPGRVKVLAFEALPQLLTEIASRTATLKTLEGALLSLILSQRNGNGNGNNNPTGLLDAPELAKRFGVPESWVREQARLGNLPSFKLGHYVRFRLQEVEHFLAERASQAG